MKYFFAFLIMSFLIFLWWFTGISFFMYQAQTPPSEKFVVFLRDNINLALANVLKIFQ